MTPFLLLLLHYPQCSMCLMDMTKLFMHCSGLRVTMPTQANGFYFLNNAGLSVQLALHSGWNQGYVYAMTNVVVLAIRKLLA
ncbi:hypothetical protein RchiOBHm_Chr5g0048231 [Rosa chinensis]|uniref:Uncharacterized protein n=1 Tax=Rosa chinensis TaxID=74649 RepID=A0A2P6QEI4_ROSCH|nr:hypothetical protein RchiOBHm_Chr5g0048231 [Rosa chinensis]